LPIKPLDSSWPPAWLTPVDPQAIERGDGKYAGDFAEAFGSVGKDGIAGHAGDSLKLRPWQRQLLQHLYARDLNGGLMAQTALIGMPRKSGKSALASAAIGLYSLIAEGINGGEVIAVAAEKEQARIVFGEAKRMVENSELRDMVTVYKDSIFVPGTNSVFKVVSAEAYSKEGLNPSRVIMDELHAHKNRELFDVFSLAMGNRGKLAQLVAITTAGVKSDSTGQDSICYSLYQYGQKVARGEIVDPSFFMAWWEAPQDGDHRNPENWKIANPGFDDIVSAEDFVSAVQRTPEAEFRTKRLNQWVSSQTAWLPNGSWDSLAIEYELQLEDEYVLGFDGSFSGDTTVVVGCTIPTDDRLPHVFLVKAWEKSATDDESWRVEMHEVEESIRDFCARFPNVREIACDPYRWQRSMEALQDMGLPIVEYSTTNAKRMVIACAKAFDAVVDKKLTHDGNPLLARHLSNAVVKTDNLGPRIVKENRASSRRIDAAVAFVAGHDRATAKLEGEVFYLPQVFS
jgi:phage terminase large subunit-like protein